MTLKYYLEHPDINWTCNLCALPNFSDSFFTNDHSEHIVSSVLDK